ncbi:hypothetical protein [Oryzicola mucosus]|uniref:Uncharacterized protein n=1 Tax=Oryzicola mucosus TaxID=2767425 RepID=A0A8J6PMS4_9HYPH|nr:hypothetical protein [Oryzicola mucosus]MBD0414532.1 hypothetical protein [Oryzicola mucosus]
MFGNFHDGHDARNHPLSHAPNASGDARHAAWKLLSDPRDGADHQASHVRPHRGMLPDVDYSRIVPDPSHRPLLRRLVGAVVRLFKARRRAPASAVSADDDGGVADRGLRPYMSITRPAV